MLRGCDEGLTTTECEIPSNDEHDLRCVTKRAQILRMD